jgi:tRNA G10  N-methylase Trm11
MLPPKLAQTMVNLAAGQIDRIENRELSIQNRNNIPHSQSPIPNSNLLVLDPFCGTGVILQESLLMGYSAYGTDIEPRMVEYTKKNLQWLVKKNPGIVGKVTAEQADATSYKWPGFSTIASEVYLGRPLAKFPDETTLKQIVSDTNTVIKKFLQNLAPQLKTGQTFCLAVPTWRKPGGQQINLPVLDKLTDMGYNYSDLMHVSRKDLVYYREDQVVARQLLRLKKAS